MRKIKSFIVLFIFAVALISIVSCGNDVSATSSVQEKAKAFSIGNYSYDTLQEAVDSITENKSSKSTIFTISLNFDVKDEGAEIPDLSGSLVLNFGSFTYTLSAGSKGIVINNPGGTIIQNGSITVDSGAALAEGTKAVISTKTGLTVSDIKLKLEESLENGIEASSGTVELTGATEISTKGDKKTIIASETAQVSVSDGSDVVLTGGLKMTGSSEVDLGGAIVNLTSEIEKGEDVFFSIDSADNIKIGSDLEEDVFQSITGSIGEALHNHQWIKDEQKSRKPTCTEDGYDYMVCSENSEHVKQETIPATGHSVSEAWTTDDDYHWHAATCGHEEINFKSQHEWSDWIITTEATHTTVGEKTRTCSICKKTEIIEIPANVDAHTFSEAWSFDETHHWHESTCGHDFKNSYSEHKWSNLVITVNSENTTEGMASCFCSECGKEIVFNYPVENLFSVSEDGVLYFSSYLTVKGALVIPKQVRNVTVSSIGNRAFVNCSNLSKIVIPSSVIIIGPRAFDGCTGLTEVVFEDDSSIEIIGEHAFSGCTGLKEIEIPKNVTSIGYDYSSDWHIGAFDDCSCSISFAEGMVSIPANALSGETGITAVTIPSTVTNIGDSAFNGCTGLKAIVFEGDSSLESIGEKAFYGCVGLTEIEIPKKVTSIGREAFRNCVLSISFAEGMIAIPDSLYLAFGTISSVSIPSTVTAIGEFAFLGCKSLTKIEIPSSVTNIGYGAFEGCTELKEIVFEGDSSLKSIGKNAFYGCTSLTEIEIPASVESVGESAFRDCTGLMQIKISSAFSTSALLKGPFHGCTGSVIFAEGMTSIPAYVLHGASGITSVSIPLTVTNIGEWAFYGCKSLTEVRIPKNVTSISRYAFSGCEGLTTIEIPASVTSLGAGVFSYCDGLKNVVFSGSSSIKTIGNYSFKGCSGLTELIIPSSVTSIGEEAFRGCTGLTNIIFKEDSSLERIVREAFSDCSSLTEIVIPKTVTSIGDDAFRGCSCSVSFAEGMSSIPAYALYGASEIASVTIPSTVTSIGEMAFAGCACSVLFSEGLLSIPDNALSNAWAITSVTIPSTTTSIGAGSFSGCIGLTDIEIPSSVTNIGHGAFEGCTGLNKISFAENSSLESIGSKVFSGCTCLTEIKIPKKVSSIGGYAFEGCTRLTEIEIPSTVTNIGSYAFEGCSCSVLFAEGMTSIPAYVLYGTPGITSVSIPSTVINIGKYAFFNCEGLTEIEIPVSVESIGEKAFYNCNSLERLSFLSPVATIGDNAFERCTGLVEIIIPAAVIGNEAFYYCTGLKKVTLLSSVTTIKTHAFYGCTGLTEIEIPCSVKHFSGSGSLRGSITNVIFSEGTTTIPDRALYSANVTSVRIPSTVTSIGFEAFARCCDLTEIILPNSVTSISGRAFEGCSRLTEIIIPKGVTVIGYQAFYYCTNLTAISFDGTKSEWNAIEKGEWWNRTVPATVVHCSDGDVPL